jgi:hypothetical protein
MSAARGGWSSRRAKRRTPSDAATAVRESIGGALAAGRRLSRTAESEVASAAGATFAQAVSIAALVCAGLLVLASVWMLVTLRGKQLEGPESSNNQ